MKIMRKRLTVLLAAALAFGGTIALAEECFVPMEAPVGELEEFALDADATAAGEQSVSAAIAEPEAIAPVEGGTAVSAPELAPMEAVVPAAVSAMELTGNASVTMNVGDILVVGVPGAQLKSLKTSKASRVACADDGTITALAEGSAKVTVATLEGLKFKLTVKVVDPYKPEAVALSPGGEFQMTLQDVVALTPVLAPETARATFTWKSSKPKVVIVDNGVLYPQSEGTATITVKTQNKKSAKVKVRVVDPYKPDAVAMDVAGTVTVKVGESFVITPSVSPATAQAILTWSSSKPGVASVDANGLVTALGKGTAKITVKTQNRKSARVTVKVLADEAATASGLPMRMSASRYKYFRKYMSQAELDAAVAVVQPYLVQLLDLPMKDQVYGVWGLVSSFGFSYSMKEKHYNDPYGLLVKGVASCAGTTRTAGFCLNLLGIEYQHVNENQYDHQWTRLLVDGEWWICDAYGGFGYCGPEGDPNEPITVYDDEGNLLYVTFAYMNEDAYNASIVEGETIYYDDMDF